MNCTNPLTLHLFLSFLFFFLDIQDLEEEGQRTVPEDELRAYTDLHKIPYFETSAKVHIFST